ncbi:hypothetical protein C8R47DRAFT_1172632 [Mycena vitilis]|nr:hypothetical protein C8R47DRAFT_1172632 [Mycena vitilis]
MALFIFVFAPSSRSNLPSQCATYGQNAQRSHQHQKSWRSIPISHWRVRGDIRPRPRQFNASKSDFPLLLHTLHFFGALGRFPELPPVVACVGSCSTGP